MRQEIEPRQGATYEAILEDGTLMVVYPYIYNDRICLGDPSNTWGYDRGWCVPKGRGAGIARSWDGQGDPPEWIKEVGTERRSGP